MVGKDRGKELYQCQLCHKTFEALEEEVSTGKYKCPGCGFPVRWVLDIRRKESEDEKLKNEIMKKSETAVSTKIEQEKLASRLEEAKKQLRRAEIKMRNGRIREAKTILKEIRPLIERKKVEKWCEKETNRMRGVFVDLFSFRCYEEIKRNCEDQDYETPINDVIDYSELILKWELEDSSISNFKNKQKDGMWKVLAMLSNNHIYFGERNVEIVSAPPNLEVIPLNREGEICFYLRQIDQKRDGDIKFLKRTEEKYIWDGSVDNYPVLVGIKWVAEGVEDRLVPICKIDIRNRLSGEIGSKGDVLPVKMLKALYEIDHDKPIPLKRITRVGAQDV